MILSGGDPWSLSTPKLAELTDALADVAHLRRVRIHTRLPVVLPERVDESLLDWLGALPWPVTVVLHANHPRELSADARDAMGRLAEPDEIAGIVVFAASAQGTYLTGANITVDGASSPTVV